ncbi:hypothetical protein D1818_21230 [Aquimarina sp. BL5]|uniref:hypothetical protein n=1 Tax=Aquimarina sp. BL5 TaxID=1714860 RepID=UPI000E4BF02B|nr:hypothetical protein [Aquimarina sp. BL5]AXT53226.1 hypothetical protein D1818_21230 [Aquimarina sp. BL5]RKN02933.1 hypothetical protein D7036_15305 [Aquimarina sp. BL5]
MDLNKNNLILFLVFLISTFGISQTKQIIIVDELTNEPIEGVHLLYGNLEEGSYTNADGVANIILREEVLTISHLNYQDLTIPPKEIELLSTVVLKPDDVQLDEVVVNSFNLKKALQYVLDNYYDLYVNYPTEKECSFKETLLVDNKIHRLILSDLKIWTKDAGFNNRKLEKNIKLKLGTVSQNKNVPMAFDINDKGESNPESSGNIITKSLLLNTYLDAAIAGFLKYSGMIEETVEVSSPDVIIVSFTTDWKNVNAIANRTKGKFVFDKKTKAVIEFIKEIELRNDIKKKTSSFSNKEYQYETKSQVISYNFTKKIDKKYSLSKLGIEANVVLSLDDKNYNTNFKNNLFVLKETKKRRFGNNGIVDLEQPIYKMIPSNVINSNAIVLTAKEKEFLESED